MATKTVGELSHGELEYWVAKAQGEQFILMGPDGPFLDIKGLCIRLHYTVHETIDKYFSRSRNLIQTLPER